MSTVFHSCTELRRVKIIRGTMNILTGETKMGETTVETRPCAAPLFTAAERESGLCRACASGWEVEGNRKATEDEAREYHAESPL